MSSRLLAAAWLVMSLVLFAAAVFGLPTEQPSTHDFGWHYAAFSVVALLAAIGSWRRAATR